MPVAEIAYEYIVAAHEATRGTAIANPTHYLPLFGTLTPFREKYRPNEARGNLAATYRSKTTKTGLNWSLEGALDPRYAMFFANMAINGTVTTPTTPPSATTTRLWTFPRVVTTDSLKSATIWYGDPNVQIYRGTYCLPDTWTITADTAGGDAAMMTMTGQGRFPTQVAAPTLPAQVIGDMLIPGSMQAWIDIGATAIGTTEITSRLVSTEWTIPTGVTYKPGAKGPTSDRSFRRTGITKTSPEVTLTVELDDQSDPNEYTQFEADTPVKLRVRLNGDLIETTFYSFVEIDIYGQLDTFAWGELEGSNRTFTMRVLGEYTTAITTDCIVRVQNTATAV